MDWTKIKIKHFVSSNLSYTEKGRLITLIALTAMLEREPTKKEIRQFCGKPALNWTQSDHNLDKFCPQNVIKKVLEDVQKVHHKKEVSRETSTRYRKERKKSDTSRDTSCDTTDKIREEKIYTYYPPLWNGFAKKHGLPQIQGLTKDRVDKLRTRIKNGFSVDVFKKICAAAEKQDFLFGKDGGWKMTFDWLIKNDQNYMKVLEMTYQRGNEGGRKYAVL